MGYFKKDTNRSAIVVARYFLHWAERNGNHNGIAYEDMVELLDITQSVMRQWYKTTIFHPKTTWQVYPERLDIKFNPLTAGFSHRELDLLKEVARLNIEVNAKPVIAVKGVSTTYIEQAALIARAKANR